MRVLFCALRAFLSAALLSDALIAYFSRVHEHAIFNLQGKAAFTREGPGFKVGKGPSSKFTALSGATDDGELVVFAGQPRPATVRILEIL